MVRSPHRASCDSIHGNIRGRSEQAEEIGTDAVTLLIRYPWSMGNNNPGKIY